MFKVIGGDQKEYGPVTAQEILRWIAEGRLNRQSRIMAEGTTEWKNLEDFPEFAAALASRAGQTPGQQPPPFPTAGVAWSSEVLARLPSIQIGRCLSRSWTLLTANLGLFAGATFVVWVISLCQFLPLIGLVYRLFAAVLYGGLYLIFLKRIRGEPAAVSQVFTGFNLAFGQLVLVGLVSYVLGFLGFCFCIIPGIYLLVAWIFSVPLVADKRLEFWSAMELSRKVVTRVWFEVLGLLIVAFLPVILASILSNVTMSVSLFPAIQDILRSGQPDIGRLMRAFGHVSGTELTLGFIVKVVMLVNLPFAVGALMYAYEDLFPKASNPAA